MRGAAGIADLLRGVLSRSGIGAGALRTGTEVVDDDGPAGLGQ